MGIRFAPIGRVRIIAGLNRNPGTVLAMAAGLVHVIYNPVSGRGHDPRFLDDLARHLSIRGFSVEISVTHRPGHGTQLARQTPDDARCVVSIGGDGTHRDVLAGLTGRPVPACVVPSGTENVLARTFRLTGTLAETLHVIHHGRPVEIDVGEVNGRPFIMFSGVGFDAAVTQEVHRRRHGRIRREAYYGPIARQWWRYRFSPISVTVDGRGVTDEAGIVLVANTPLYGGRLRIASRAVADDGLLDVVCLKAASRWQMLRLFLLVRCGRHLGHPLATCVRGRHVEVVCRERPLPVQADGDAVAATPAVYNVRPRAVRFLILPSLLARATSRSSDDV